MTQRTKKLKTAKNWLTFFSYFILVTTFITYIILGIMQYEGAIEPMAGEDSVQVLTDDFVTILVSMATTGAVLLLLLIIVGHKIKTTIWLITIILAAYIGGTALMWVTFGIWIVDTYIVDALKDSCKRKYEINNEIDRRG